MKYVAFLDILGFKSVLNNMKQVQATQYIANFSTTAYLEWEKMSSHLLEGYIVSDSFIIYSHNTSENALYELLQVVGNICKSEFSMNSILIRGAIASGDFDRIEAKELATLKKGLIVGQAYVDAYLLESTAKVPGILLTEQVYRDAQNIPEVERDLFEEKAGNNNSYVFRYISSDYLLTKDRLRNFIQLAKNSCWLPHYYNAIYFALKNDNSKKVTQVFANILDVVCDDKPEENWRHLDDFIRNAFNKDVAYGFQTRLLRYLRRKLF